MALPAPLALLEHLVQNVDLASVDASSDRAEVYARRAALARREPAAIAEALAELRSGRRGRRWFVLEGPSRPDAVLEAVDFVLCVEGKRTEVGCTVRTRWMTTRSQLLRHMDAAMDAFPTKAVFGILIVEGEGGADSVQPSPHWQAELAAQVDSAMVERSLPHRDGAIRARLRRNVMGVTTWQAVCAATGLEWQSLPAVS